MPPHATIHTAPTRVNGATTAHARGRWAQSGGTTETAHTRHVECNTRGQNGQNKIYAKSYDHARAERALTVARVTAGVRRERCGDITSALAVDLDGDGDDDALSESVGGGTIAWYDRP